MLSAEHISPPRPNVCRFADLALARVDIYIESLRRRHLRHVVVAKLDLLTHLLPKLLPFKATSCLRQERAISYESRLSFTSDRSSRIRWPGHRQFGRRIHSTSRTLLAPLPENVLTEQAIKQPPPSVESIMDSGVAFSDGSLYSVPSVETPIPAAIAASPNETVADKCNSKDEPLQAIPIKVNHSFPVASPSPLAALVDSGIPPSPLATFLSTNVKMSNDIQRHSLTVKRKSKSHQSIPSTPTVRSPANCCIPS